MRSGIERGRESSSEGEEGWKRGWGGGSLEKFTFSFSFLFFCSRTGVRFLHLGEIKAGKGLKNVWGREEEMAERPGEVAPERTGLLEPTTRNGL
jgi:hypothetical protein